MLKIRERRALVKRFAAQCRKASKKEKGSPPDRVRERDELPSPPGPRSGTQVRLMAVSRDIECIIRPNHFRGRLETGCVFVPFVEER